jgi:ubiquinone/menaquinone biosynthesis C-methylase UbiE
MTATNYSSAPATKGHVLHWGLAYDLLVWLLLGGRERAFRERLIQLARLESDDSVLDIGCGSGSLAIAAKQRVGLTGTVHGIDASPEMIARAKRKASKAGVDVAFASGVAEALQFPDAHFDAVLSTMMLHHLPWEIRRLCVREAHRVLKPGGRMLAVDFGGSPAERKGIIAHFHRHGGIVLDDLVKLLTEAGFTTVDSGAVGVRNVNFVLGTA